MAINVRTDDVSGEVMAWGQAAFSDSPPEGQTDAALPQADETDEVLLNTYGPKYCTVSAGRIVADTLASAKAAKVKSIRGNTADLVGQGAVYEGTTYMDTDKGRFDVLGIHTLGVIGSDPVWPAMFTDIDGDSQISFADADEFSPFFDAMMGAYQHWQATGQVLVQEVIVATTVEEVDAVTDDRSWPAPLMYWVNGTFANASGDRFIWAAADKVLHGPYAGGVPAIAMIDGMWWVQIEGARTNIIPGDLSTYTVRGTTVRTASQADPLGGTAAFKIEVLNTGSNDMFNNYTGVTADAVVAASLFIKRISTTGVVFYKNGFLSGRGNWSIDLALLGDGWERITAQHPAVTVVAAFQNTDDGKQGSHIGVTSGGPVNIYVWQTQEVEAAFPSSIIAEATTRAADSLSFAAGQLPAAFLTGKWSIDITTMFESADVPNSGAHNIFFIDGNNRLYIERSGGGTYRVRFKSNGVVLVRTMTHSRDQTMTITIDHPGGSMTLAGFTTGDGTVTGGSTAGWTPGTMEVGTSSNSAHFFGRISEPVPA